MDQFFHSVKMRLVESVRKMVPEIFCGFWEVRGLSPGQGIDTSGDSTDRIPSRNSRLFLYLMSVNIF